MIDVAAGNKIYYYHYDGLGSVVALSDVNSDVVELYEYDVFGQVTIWDATLDIVGQSTVGNPYMFTGRRLDAETGLYYYRFRYYDPYTGRFLQTDPIGYRGGLNLYEYCFNNPVNWLDPFGLSISPSTDKKVKKWYRQGRSVEDIAEDLGLEPEEVENILEDEKEKEESDKNCPKNEPLPPGHSDDWEKAPASRESQEGDNWWDPSGGEWHWHPADKDHPDDHWDHNPWDNWNSEWRRIPK